MTISPHILFLPGIWSPAFFLHSLAKEMTCRGYRASFVSYNSVLEPPCKVMERVYQHISKHPGCHIVGHSMGGVLAVNMLKSYPDIETGHVVCLGSPLQGSKVAKTLAQFKPGKVYLGQSGGWLTKAHSVEGGKVGVIAGNHPRGLGKFFTQLDGEHDGTVEVQETYTKGLEDHVTILASHTGLLWHRQSSSLIDGFLKRGKF